MDSTHPLPGETAEQPQPLWTDTRIQMRAKRIQRTGNQGAAHAMFMASLEMRDDLQATIAELERQLEAERAASRIADARLQLAQEEVARLTGILEVAKEHDLVQSLVIKALKAQVAQGWEPLPDGLYYHENDMSAAVVKGNTLRTTATDEYSTTIILPDNYRLCRRTGTAKGGDDAAK